MTFQQYKNDVFIAGSQIDLLALSEDIVRCSNWYGWFNDEENTKTMQKHYFPNTKEDQLLFFRNEVC